MRISDWSSYVCSSDLSHRHSYIEASCGVVYPEAVAIAHSRSKGGPSMGRMTKPGAAAKRSGKMQIAWPSAWKVGPPIGVRPGRVHSAHDRRDVLEPVVIRVRYRSLRRSFRGDSDRTRVVWGKSGDRRVDDG